MPESTVRQSKNPAPRPSKNSRQSPKPSPPARQKAEPKRSPTAEKDNKREVKKPQKASAIGEMAVPLLGPKVEPVHAGPSLQSLGGAWEGAKEWFGSFAHSVVQAPSNVEAPFPSGEPQKKKEDDTATVATDNPRETYKKGLRSKGVPEEYLMNKGSQRAVEIYSRYQLARKFHLDSELPGYLSGKSYPPEETSRQEQNAINYFAQQLGELRPVVDGKVQKPIYVPALIAEMNRIITYEQKNLGEKFAKSYTAKVNRVKHAKHPKARRGRYLDSIQFVVHNNRILDWDTLQKEVMRLTLSTPSPRTPSFEALDRNLRREWNIENGEELVLVKSSNRELPWNTTYNRLFEQLIKGNAEFVLDYDALPTETLLELEVRGPKQNKETRKYVELSNAIQQGGEPHIAEVRFSNPTPEFIRAINATARVPMGSAQPSVTLPYSFLEAMTTDSWMTAAKKDGALGEKWLKEVREMFQKGSSEVTLLDDGDRAIISLPNALWLKAFGIPATELLRETIDTLSMTVAPGSYGQLPNLISLQELSAEP